MTALASPDRDLWRRFARLSAINILANITVPLVGLVDTAMLGHLEDVRFLAGVALGALLFDYLYWSFGFLRMATTGTTAQAVGRGERDAVDLQLVRGLCVALALGLLVVLLRAPLGHLGFRVLAGTAAVEAAGLDYFSARVLAAPLALSNFVLLGWFLGREQSGRALVMTVVGNLTNVFFNWLFIVELGLAARGAGLASALGQGTAFLVAITLAWRTGALRSSLLRPALEPGQLAALFRLNGDLFVRTFCLITAFALFTNLSALLGTAVLAANAILLRVLELASWLIDGCAFALESLAGILFGGGDRRRLRRVLWLGLGVGEALALLFLVPLLLAPTPILSLLTSHREVVDRAVAWSPWLLPVLLFGAAAYMLDGFFLGLTAGRVLRVSMLLAAGLVFLPLALLAVALESPMLLWLAMAALMVARSLTLAWAARPWLAAEGAT